MVSTRSRVRLPVAAALAACFALACVPALASPGDRLDKLQHRQSKVRHRITSLGHWSGVVSEKVKALDAKREKAEQRVRALDGRLDSLNVQITRLQRDLARVQKHLAVIHQELLDIQARLVKRTDVFTQRARAIYEAGPNVLMNGLLSSDDFGDLVDRYTYYRSALDSDQALVEEISALRDEMSARQAEVAKKEHRIASAKLELERKRAQVAEAKRERERVLDRRKNAVAAKQALLAKIRRNKTERERIAREIEAEIGRVKDIIAAAQAAAAQQSSSAGSTLPVAGGGSGELAWPASGPVTSSFGMRVDPVTHQYQLHAGIDIGVSYGTPVGAADDGTVIYVGTMSGYGNVVVVDHGGGLSTLYAHLSSYIVGSGQHVSRGEHIANSGCTGWCTGPHLHFEVRVNGNPVNPLPYLG